MSFNGDSVIHSALLSCLGHKKSNPQISDIAERWYTLMSLSSPGFNLNLKSDTAKAKRYVDMFFVGLNSVTIHLSPSITIPVPLEAGAS